MGEMMDWLYNAMVDLRGILEIRAFQLGDRDVTVLRIVIFFILLLSLKSIIGGLQKVLSAHLNRKGRENNQSQYAVKILGVLCWCVGGVILLDLIGVGVSSILTLLAALGIGIGFGLQNLINNAFSGLILLFERPIRVGDIIESDGIVGRVIRVGWRATVVVTLDNVELLIPNSHILDNKLTNLSFSDSNMRIHVNFGVHYSSDPKLVREIALKLAQEHENVLEAPAPQVHFTEFGDSSLNFSLRAWINSPWDKYRIISDIYYALFDALKENGIEIPYPQRDLHLRTSDIGRLETET